jgi:hypothetical protein
MSDINKRINEAARKLFRARSVASVTRWSNTLANLWLLKQSQEVGS